MSCATWDGWVGYPAPLEWDAPCHWVEFFRLVAVNHCPYLIKAYMYAFKIVWLKLEATSFLVGIFNTGGLLRFLFWSTCCYQPRDSVCSQTDVLSSTIVSTPCRMKMATLLKLSMAYQLTKIIRHLQFRYHIFFYLSIPWKRESLSGRQCRSWKTTSCLLQSLFLVPSVKNFVLIAYAYP